MSLDHLEKETVEIDFRRVSFASGIDFRELQQLVGQPPRSLYGQRQFARDIGSLFARSRRSFTQRVRQDLDGRQRRAKFMRGIRNELPLLFDRRSLAAKQLGHGLDKRPYFNRRNVKRQRLGRVDAASRQTNACLIESLEKPAHGQDNDRPRNGDGRENGQRRAHRQLFGNVVAHLLAVRNLDGAPASSSREDAPGDAIDRQIDKAVGSLPGNVDATGRSDLSILHIPDLDDEFVFGIVLKELWRQRLPAVAYLHGDLSQLAIEEEIRLVPPREIGDEHADQAHGREDRCDPGQGRPANGRHDASLITSQPAPRTLRMISLSNLRRMLWIRTSTALLSISSRLR